MVRAAIVGVGDISGIYIKNILHLFDNVELAGLYNRTRAKAEAARDKIREEVEAGLSAPVPVVYDSLEELLADDSVQVVLNLTTPEAHFGISKACLLAGKHVYTEKPLGITFEEGEELLRIADEKGLFLCGAPDTFLGAGIQTCRKLIDDGVIGDVIGGRSAIICRGHETWHPNPAFYYKTGGGPMLDMGPYHITALVNLLGSAVGVIGMTKKSFAERTVTSKPRYGEKITVETDTFMTGSILFENGAIVSVFATFDAYYELMCHLEIYGSKGTLEVPDPNTFGGPVLLYGPDEVEARARASVRVRPDAKNPCPDFREVPLTFGYAGNSRGVGVMDMCGCIEKGGRPRADLALQLHVLEIMTAFSKASERGAYIPLKTRWERTAPMEENR